MDFQGYPDWVNGSLYGSRKDLSPKEQKIQEEINHGIIDSVTAPPNAEPVLQQSDLLKPFLLDISEYGLNYAYNKYYEHSKPLPVPAGVDPYEEYKETKTEHAQDVIIIGAGMSGLVAAYELAQVGHNVTILEMQHRVGGRIKTIGDSHFYKGLWSDAGAMRLPGDGLEPVRGNTKPSHFMTDFYAQKFQVPVIPFVNTCSNGYYKFYGQEAIRMSDWDKDKKGYCNTFWPGWDKNLSEALKQLPDFDIGAYYEATVAPVKKQLEHFLIECPTTAWERWISLWSRFSINVFLRSTYDEVLLKLQRSSAYKDEFAVELQPLKALLPWSEEAVVAFFTISYVPSTGMTLIDFLRDELGQWWTDPMHTFKNGMTMLPESFVKKNKNGWNKKVKLSDMIIFGTVAYKITYTESNVIVTCRNQTTMEKQVFKGDKVIITLPINVVRGLTFTPPLPPKYYQAFESISVEASTKVMIQSRTRFWESDGIQGGFTKTNMPIGQIHYPSNPNFEIPNDERGILMCYTWKSEALLFGSQTKQNAIAEVVEELAEIHPEITTQFEVGAIQSWYDDPSAQGAFVLLSPDEYDDMKLLIRAPHQSVYFCGEALSYANGWIQGALESGLRSAYQLFADNENRFK